MQQPIHIGIKTSQDDGFPTGYGRYQQDVLLPAFIAAYTGKDPGSISLIDESYKTIKTNPFKGVHALPNWRVTYTGLTKIAVTGRYIQQHNYYTWLYKHIKL